VLSSGQVRDQVLMRLTPELIANFITREIFEVLRQVSETNGTVEFAALEGRLSPAGQTLLHEAFMADETIEETVFLERAEACLRRLESDARRKQVDELRARVRAAERDGRMEDAIGLMAELLKRERE
jgi:hypothetical protein